MIRQKWAGAVLSFCLFAALPIFPSSAAPVPAATPSPVVDAKPKTSLIGVPPIANKSFGPGEKLVYIIKYEFVAAGRSSLTVTEGAPTNGRPTLALASQASSNDVTDVFFKVRDYNLSLVDRATLATLRFHQNLHEGGYKVIRNTAVDYEKGVFNFDQLKKGKTRTSTGPVDGPASDILSSFFYTRTLALEPGKNYRVKVLSDEKVYFLTVKVDPKTEKIRVPAGKFDCLKIQPQIVGDSIFKAGDDGRMTIWLTNDDRRIPVLIRSKIAIGAFDAELETIELPKP